MVAWAIGIEDELHIVRTLNKKCQAPDTHRYMSDLYEEDMVLDLMDEVYRRDAFYDVHTEKKHNRAESTLKQE